MNDNLKSEPFYVWITQGILQGIIQILKVLFGFGASIFLSLFNFFKNFGFNLYKLGLKIYQGIIYYAQLFIKGDVITKLSFVVMGIGAFARKQIVKGLGYVAIQVITIVLTVNFFAPYLAKFPTLGDTVGIPTYFDPTHPDADIFGYVPSQLGDNSMIILLLSVGGIIVILIGFYFYLQNIRLAFQNQQTLASGKTLPNFQDELKSLLNERFHITVLSWPVLFAFIFTVLPLGFMILIAFTEFDRFHQPPGTLFTWVGFTNFINMFSGTNAFYSQLPSTLWAISRPNRD